MREGWEIKKLGDVVDIINGRNQSGVISTNGQYPIYGSAGNLMGYATDYLCEGGTTIIGRKGNISNPIFIDERFWNVDTAFGLYPKYGYDPKFLNYLCQTIDFKSRNRGTTIPSLVKSDLLTIDVPFVSSLPEQQRIVAILDECFAALEKAKANAEQNLKNAKELFESVLNSINAEKVALGSLVNITTGKLNANAAVEGGEYPFFTCSREIYSIDNYAFDLEAILLAGNNASGDFNVKHYKGKFNAYQRTYIITVNESHKAIYRYLYFQLLKSLKEFKEVSVGANTRFLKLGMIQGLKIALPSIEQQQTIVGQLDALRVETQKLEAVYEQKLTDLEELKKSILQKAFAGELTAKSIAS
jgi:type I restriction enzyme S subunit